MKNLGDGDWTSAMGVRPQEKIKEEDKVVLAKPIVDFNILLKDFLDYYENTPSSEGYDLLINLKRASSSYNKMV